VVVKEQEVIPEANQVTVPVVQELQAEPIVIPLQELIQEPDEKPRRSSRLAKNLKVCTSMLWKKL
jgi:hypothetical protein